jgi:hypothetical protein
MTWLVENLDLIFQIWGMIVALCTAIVAITPTQKDNTFLAKIVKWADVFSVVFTKKDAETIAKALEKKKK